MYLHFEDWSVFIPSLDRKNIPHGDRIIKVFATDYDPREKFNKDTLKIIHQNHEPFTNEVFDLGQRGFFGADEFEGQVAARTNNEDATRTIRALTRFAMNEGFMLTGMNIQVDGKYLIDHPLDGIDGWQYINWGQSEKLHLDIFSATSLTKLKDTVDYNDPSQILSLREVKDLAHMGKVWRSKEG